MSRPLVPYDGIAIAELIFFLIALVAAILLCLRHGFTKDLGWRALLVLSLVRVLGSALRLATISAPTNINLYIGWQVLNGIGLAPLLLLLTGLLARVFSSLDTLGPATSTSSCTSFKTLHKRAVLLILLLTIVLFSIGGSRSTVDIGPDGQFNTDYSPLSMVAVVLQIVVLALTAAAWALAASRIRHVPPRERRIVHVVALCVPIVAARLTYSCLIVLGEKKSSPWLYLGLSSIPEMVVTLVSVILGFSLDVLPKDAGPLPQSEW